MRLYTLLKQIIKMLTDGATLKDSRIKFPNGLKVCWGRGDALKSGSVISIPETYTSGIAIIMPYYYNANSMRCVYSGFVSGNSLTIYAFDMRTAANYSSAQDLYVQYLVIGY